MPIQPAFVFGLTGGRTGDDMLLFPVPVAGALDPAIANGAGGDALGELTTGGKSIYKADVDGDTLVGAPGWYFATFKDSGGNVLPAAPAFYYFDNTTTPALPHSLADMLAVSQNSLADAILSRNVSNVEATADEHTLATIILAMLEWAVSGTTLTIKRTDGSTTHYTKTLTTDAAADPVTSAN